MLASLRSERPSRVNGSVRITKVVVDLFRASLRRSRGRDRKFRQRSAPLGLRVDVTHVADALERLEDDSRVERNE